MIVSRNVTAVNGDSFAADIVKQEYLTAAVFSKYGIEFCCGAKFPLKMVCEIKELSLENVLKDLYDTTRVIRVSSNIPFQEWEIDFLADYIVRIHHRYLQMALPAVKDQLQKFAAEHKKKYPHLAQVEEVFLALQKLFSPHIQQEEEEVLFPYIKQIAHAYNKNEAYASLFVRTLHKPIENNMGHEHNSAETKLQQLRVLTNNYTAPEAACTSHRLVYSMLQELDDDLVQHLYLENDILFPKAIAMEKELLLRQ